MQALTLTLTPRQGRDHCAYLVQMPTMHSEVLVANQLVVEHDVESSNTLQHLLEKETHPRAVNTRPRTGKHTHRYRQSRAHAQPTRTNLHHERIVALLLDVVLHGQIFAHRARAVEQKRVNGKEGRSLGHARVAEARVLSPRVRVQDTLEEEVDGQQQCSWAANQVWRDLGSTDLGATEHRYGRVRPHARVALRNTQNTKHMSVAHAERRQHVGTTYSLKGQHSTRRIRQVGHCAHGVAQTNLASAHRRKQPGIDRKRRGIEHDHICDRRGWTETGDDRRAGTSSGATAATITITIIIIIIIIISSSSVAVVITIVIAGVVVVTVIGNVGIITVVIIVAVAITITITITTILVDFIVCAIVVLQVAATNTLIHVVVEVIIVTLLISGIVVFIHTVLVFVRWTAIVVLVVIVVTISHHSRRHGRAATADIRNSRTGRSSTRRECFQKAASSTSGTNSRRRHHSVAASVKRATGIHSGVCVACLDTPATTSTSPRVVA
jgi:hypothetical protein